MATGTQMKDERGRVEQPDAGSCPSCVSVLVKFVWYNREDESREAKEHFRKESFS